MNALKLKVTGLDISCFFFIRPSSGKKECNTSHISFKLKGKKSVKFSADITWLTGREWSTERFKDRLIISLFAHATAVTKNCAERHCPLPSFNSVVIFNDINPLSTVPHSVLPVSSYLAIYSLIHEVTVCY